MPHGAWRVRRTAVRARLLIALTALTFTVTLLIAGILGQTHRDSIDGVRGYLAGLDGPEGVSQIATSLGGDPEQQNRAFAAVMSATFGDQPVISHRRLVSAAYEWEIGGGDTSGDTSSGDTSSGDTSGGDTGGGDTGTSGGGTGTGDAAETVTLRLGSYDDVAEHVTVVDGSWPSGAADSDPTAVAIPAATAAAWDLEVGDGFQVRAISGAGRDLQVAATFDRDESTFWSAEQTLLTGRAVADRSPVLMVDPAVLTGSTSVPTVSWTVVAELSRIVPDDIAPVAAGITALPTVVRSERQIDVNGTLSGGDLAASLAVVQASLDAAVVAQPLPIMLVIAFGLVMLLQLGRLITEDRRSETSLLKSRGLSAGRLSAWAAVEGALFAAPGAALGLLAAAVVTGLTGAGWWVAGATAVVAVVAMAAPAWRMGFAPLLRDRMDDSGRGHSVMAVSALVLLLGAAAFAVWRFRRSGADAVSDVDGRRILDPAVLLAPPITLVALVAVGLVVFGVASAAVGRAAGRLSQRLPLALPARQVARRRTVFGAVVMMLGLAVGGSAVAAGYARTATDFQQQNAAASSGSDVRVVTAGGSLSGVSEFRDPAAEYRDVPAATAVAPVLRLDTGAADSTLSLVAIDPDRLVAVTGGSAAPDSAALAAALRSGGAAGTTDAERDAARPPLPDGSTQLTMTTSIGGLEQPAEGGQPRNLEVSATAWLQTPEGALAPASLGTAVLTEQGTADLTGTLAETAPGTRVLAIDLQVADEVVGPGTTIAIRSLSATAGAGVGPIDLGAWGYQRLADDPVALEQDGTGPAARSVAASNSPLPKLVRFMQPGDPAAAIPAIIDRRTSEALKLTDGETIGVSYGPAQLSLEMAADAAVIPGFPHGSVALTDLTDLNLMLLRNVSTQPAMSEIWLASRDPGATKAAAATVAGPSATVTEVGGGSVEQLLRPAVRALWWGIAGALLLGAVGVLLVIATLSRNRRAEIAVLRALGVPSRMQATMRRRELLVTAVVSWVLGLAAGIGTAALIVPGLSRQAVVAVGAGQDPGLSFAWSTWALLIAAHLLLVLAAIGWYSRGIRRHAMVADPREVTA